MTLRPHLILIPSPPGTRVTSYLKVTTDFGDTIVPFDDRNREDTCRAHDEAWLVVNDAAPARARISIWLPCRTLTGMPVIGCPTFAEEAHSGAHALVSVWTKRGAA